MLLPTDIRPAVKAVLKQTDNCLTAYQILDRLPAELRAQIIAERGLPGAGSGKPSNAAGLVRQAVEGLLPSLNSPHRIYLDTGGITFRLAGQEIVAGHSAIALYRLRAEEPTPSPALEETD